MCYWYQIATIGPWCGLIWGGGQHIFLEDLERVYGDGIEIETDQMKTSYLLFGGKVLKDKRLPPLFAGQFSFRPIIFFVIVFSFFLFQRIGSENAVEKVGGSIWSIHCQKSTLRYINTITNNLLWSGPNATFVAYNAIINRRAERA